MLVCIVCASSMGRAGGRQAKRPALDVTVRVSGDVQAALVDVHGRRTGWYGGRVEDIPNCQLEALRDEVVEPRDYVFRLRGATKSGYRLLVTPRTEGHLSIEVEGWLGGKRACIARADTELVSGESQWRLKWKTSGPGCALKIIPVRR